MKSWLSRTTGALTVAPLLACALTLAASVPLVALTSAPARACGGFFCSQLPVDQTGETIVFGVGPDTVTAVIQINFAGEASDFAWVVPVSAAPEISLGPETLFQGLDTRTQPQWYLSWDFGDGSCGIYPPMAEADGDFGSSGGDNGITIIDQVEVGPFIAVTLSSESSGELLTWLNDNGFDQPEESKPLLEHYLGQDMIFVAVKLKEGAGAGELQPLMLEIPAADPCIPLVLTRIAAMPDMPVTAYVMGDSRAVPKNWFGVEVNEKKIDWIHNGANYAEVASAAINEAAGHGFITEYAQPVSMTNWFYAESWGWDPGALKQFTDPATFLDEMLYMNLPRDRQMQSLIKKYIPKPEQGLPEDCQEDNQFYNWNKETCLALMPQDWTFDPVGFADELEERIVVPLRKVQTMADGHSYLTRLYTSVDAHEMTRDPQFVFQADAADVSNVHQANATGVCSEDGTSIVDITVTLANGETFTIPGPVDDIWGYGWGGEASQDSSYADPAPSEPAAAAIYALGADGSLELVAPADVEAREQSFALADATTMPWDGEIPDGGGNSDGTGSGAGDGSGGGAGDGTGDGTGTGTGNGSGTGSGTGDGSGSGSSGCNGAGGGTGALVLLALLALAFVSRRRTAGAAIAALLAAGSLTAPATPAQACGGFFCSQIPVDQTGETIVFGVTEDTVTAVIQINFMGEANDFAWVVPVAAAPAISLGPETLFQGLDQRTRPQWYLNWDFGDGMCGAFPQASGAGGGGDSAGGGGVTVIDTVEVGPFIAVTLSSESSGELLTWLNDNGFDQPEESKPILEHYLGQGMIFVALKLKEGATTGELQPLMLEIPTNEPCIPLVLTRIAAQPDMPVTAYVMGDSRAVPKNWFSVEVNEKKIDWIHNGANYADVASAAINEAAGHGFITEYAQAVSMEQWFFSESWGWDPASLAQYTDPSTFLDQMLWMNLPRDRQMQSLIKKYIPKPEQGLPEGCQEDNAFYSFNKEECFGYMPADWTFDPAAFAAELEERVVVPLRKVQTMADAHGYLTRVYTSVDAHEMTRDPMFTFLPDAPDVSNVHSANAVGSCGEDGYTVQDVTITLGDGQTIFLQGPFDDIWGGGWGGAAGGPGGSGSGAGQSDYADPAPEEPAAAAIYALDGDNVLALVDPGDVEATEQSFMLSDATALPWDGEIPVDEGGGTTGGGTTGGGTTGGGTTGGGDVTTPPIDGSSDSNDGCAGGGGGGAGLVLLGLLALAIVRRRQLV